MSSNFPAKSSVPTLGDLEIAVLEHVWQAVDVSAKEAHAAIGAARGISINTVQSTLERLYRKALLTRTKSSHAFRYAPRLSREQVVAGLINDVLGRFGGNTASSLAAFVEAAERLDDEALRALEVELKNRRKRGASS